MLCLWDLSSQLCVQRLEGVFPRTQEDAQTLLFLVEERQVLLLSFNSLLLLLETMEVEKRTSSHGYTLSPACSIIVCSGRYVVEITPCDFIFQRGSKIDAICPQWAWSTSWVCGPVWAIQALFVTLQCVEGKWKTSQSDDLSRYKSGIHVLVHRVFPVFHLRHGEYCITRSKVSWFDSVWNTFDNRKCKSVQFFEVIIIFSFLFFPLLAQLIC